jgi:hypothetical protein
MFQRVQGVTRSRSSSCRTEVWLAAALLLSSACSPTVARQTTPRGDNPIVVKGSPLFVTVHNRAGLPVVDVDVAIVPVGKGTEFKKLISRIEATEERDYSLSEFRSRDGTAFSLRLTRPKAIRLTARDVVGKSYSVEVPW